MEIPKRVQASCDFIWNRAKQLLDRDGYVTSTVFLVKGRTISPLPTIFENDKEKAAFFAACSNAAKQEEVEAIMMIAEGWGLLANKGGTEKSLELELENHGKISKHPDRIEILFFSCMLPDGFTFGRTAVMIRAGDSVALIDEGEIEGEKSKTQWARMKPWGYHEGAEEDNGS